MPPITLLQWSPGARQAPTVRVGIILARDQYHRLRIDVVGPDSHPLDADGKTIPVAGPLDISSSGNGLQVQSGRSTWETPSLSIAPSRPADLEPTVIVRDVPAGRGFHWQKTLDVALPGAVEVLPKPSGLLVVNVLPIEAYLVGVITAEMSGECPLEFLKAQCIVARSWLLAHTEPKHEQDPYERCNDDCCQRYQGVGALSDAARIATADTRGLALLTADGTVLDANYSKSCGGVSELPEHVWGWPKPGVTSVVDAPSGCGAEAFLPVTDRNLGSFLDEPAASPRQWFCGLSDIDHEAVGRYLGRVDEPDDYFRWSLAVERTVLERNIRDKVPEAATLTAMTDLIVRRRGVSGRITQMSLEWRDGDNVSRTIDLPSEYQIREVLHPKFLYSSAFTHTVERASDGAITRLTLRGAGWGHGVGLCQIGALAMAIQGASADRICRHYFPAGRLEHVY